MKSRLIRNLRYATHNTKAQDVGSKVVWKGKIPNDGKTPNKKAEGEKTIVKGLNFIHGGGKGEDGNAIKKAMENLGQAAQELGKILYEEAAKQQAAQTPPSPDPEDQSPPDEKKTKRKGGDDVIDAEFEAKDS